MSASRLIQPPPPTHLHLLRQSLSSPLVCHPCSCYRTGSNLFIRLGQSISCFRFPSFPSARSAVTSLAASCHLSLPRWPRSCHAPKSRGHYLTSSSASPLPPFKVSIPSASPAVCLHTSIPFLHHINSSNLTRIPTHTIRLLLPPPCPQQAAAGPQTLLLAFKESMRSSEER